MIQSSIPFIRLVPEARWRLPQLALRHRIEGDTVPAEGSRSKQRIVGRGRSGRRAGDAARGRSAAAPARSRSGSPSPWIAPRVHTGDDNNNLTVDAVEDSIGEPMDKHAPAIPLNHRIHGRMCTNIGKCGLDSRQKLMAQASTPELVPYKRFLDIGRSRRTDNDWHYWARLRIRRSTSSQGMPAGPSRSSSSSLRSSSSRCAFVSGIASGVAERLSQSCSKSRNRSSGLRSAMSIVPMR